VQPEMTPIIAVDQVVIHFAGHDFLVVRLPDGRIAVVLRHLCEALELDRWSQIKRIQSQSALAKHLLLVRIKTPGGSQVVNALVTSVLSLWLGGFRLGRLSKEKRALIELLQSDAASFPDTFPAGVSVALRATPFPAPCRLEDGDTKLTRLSHRFVPPASCWPGGAGCGSRYSLRSAGAKSVGERGSRCPCQTCPPCPCSTCSER
jgi:hypothetical protein